MVKKDRTVRLQTVERSAGAGRGVGLAAARAAAALKRRNTAAIAFRRATACAKGKIAAAEARLKEVKSLQTETKSDEHRPVSIRMHFYTTPSQEFALDKSYKRELEKKQAQMDAMHCRARKYTPSFYIKAPPRVFHVFDGHAFVQCPSGKKETPAAAVTDGRTYGFDTKFSKEIVEFCQTHEKKGYKVIFGSGMDMSCSYFGDGLAGCLPAQLVAVSGDTLSAVDPEGWDLCCG
jgi:hypothetical protein